MIKITLKELRCNLRRINDYFLYNNANIQHVVENVDIEEDVMLAVSDNSFRKVFSYEHNSGEKIIDHAVVLTDKCIYCGKEEKSWYRKENFDEVRERMT